MAKTKYVDATPAVETTVNKIMEVWPDRFAHIQRNDILLVMKDSAKSTYKARTRLLNGFYRMLTKKKIIIEVHKQSWELDKAADRALTLYRELFRVDLREATNDYKLVKPDLTDFTKILEKTGLHGETAEDFFSKVI
ncbi:MAG: putative metallopeptidase [bacterium]